MRSLVLSIINQVFDSKISDNDISFLLLPGSMEGRTVGCLVFRKGFEDPILFLKIFRERNQLRAKKESQILKILDGSLGDSLCYIPRYLGRGYINNSPYLAQTVVDGSQYHFNFNKKNLSENSQLREKILQITKSLVDLANMSSGANQISSDIILSRYMEINEKYGLVKDKSIGRLDRINLKKVIMHGDFVPHNVLFRKDCKISLIDWTDVEFSGAGLFDLYHFLVHVAMRLRSSTSLQGLIEILHMGFFEDNQLSRIFRESISYYANHLNLSDDEVESAFYYFLMKYATNDYLKITSAIERNETPAHIFDFKLEQNIDNPQIEYWSTFLSYSLKNQSKILL